MKKIIILYLLILTISADARWRKITIRLDKRSDYQLVKDKWLEVHEDGESAIIILDKNCEMNIYLQQYCPVKKLICSKSIIREEEGMKTDKGDGILDIINEFDCPRHKKH